MEDLTPVGMGSMVTCAIIPGKGRGVVALRDVAAGTEVERSPVIIVPADDLIDRSPLHTQFDQYLLYWGDEPGQELAMGCGLLMIYNHSDEPNVEFVNGPEPYSMSVIALRDIGAGEELTYDYGVPLWFDQAPSPRTRSV
ncbi:MAG: SET domain-containing protein-lysine N-methyltransferase [Gemmatimonadota bacterium]